MKKYELTTNTKMRFRRKLFQIKALVSFGDVTAGDLGGYIEKEENLSHDGDAWVCGDARVCGDADYICLKGFGSNSRNTIMFRTKSGDVYVCCGCFEGSLKEFAEKVKGPVWCRYVSPQKVFYRLPLALPVLPVPRGSRFLLRASCGTFPHAATC